MSLVMGMDQHRAQISAEWIDTMTAEVFRARISPADRAGVRKFLKRFAGEGLEVALGATTGWRFVVEELERVGAEVHLAEPTETSGLKGKKKRAKTDWADARHLRELLLVGRLPESWIPPAHILDLRGRVRLRHTLSHQRTEWQQRIQAVLYHHGIPQRRDLLTLEKRRGSSACSSAEVAAQPGGRGLRPLPRWSYVTTVNPSASSSASRSKCPASPVAPMIRRTGEPAPRTS